MSGQVFLRTLSFLSISTVAATAATAAPQWTNPVPERTENGFAVPQPGHELNFPQAHASHPEFAIEWWYITGHLFGPGDERFGFQATFFRNAGSPPSRRGPELNRAFGDGHIYLAHMSLFDATTGEHYHEERLNRAGWDAYAKTTGLDIRNGNWSLKMTGGVHPEQMHLIGGIAGTVRFELTMTPTKEKVIFGENGISKKGPEPTMSSYYITFTRLALDGELLLEGKSRAVTGQAWMDHEISSNQLADDQLGWDWACMQFDDGRDLMVYRLRKEDGSTDPFSQLVWVEADGSLTHLSPEHWTWEHLDWWASPKTGGRYPVRNQITTVDPKSGKRRIIEIRSLAPDQENEGYLGGIDYWEGACDLYDEAGNPIGMAYKELTGYSESLADRL